MPPMSSYQTSGAMERYVHSVPQMLMYQHGVSVGSLGEYDGVKDVVENIYVNNVTIINSENGPRIKTWGGKGRGYGYVKQIVFSNFRHENNDSPITIDNCYKTTPDECLANPVCHLCLR
jgi:galacturan 1,4-alpha-galacturonidase